MLWQSALIQRILAFGKRLSWKEDTKPPAGFKLTFRQTMHIMARDVLWVAILPRWLLAIIPRFKEVRCALDELPVSVYFGLGSKFITDPSRKRYVLEMIHERRSGGSVKQNDLFSNLLAANDSETKENSLTEEELMGGCFFRSGISVPLTY